MIRTILTTTAAALLLLLAIGCSDSGNDEFIGSSDADIAAEFGGYTASPEAPGFGDPDLLDDVNDEQDYNDPLLGSAAADSLMTTDPGAFHFRAIWGRLDYDSTVTEQTNWDGSLTLSRGGLVVRKTIRFEDGQDEVLPRNDIAKVEWASITTVHNDGIAVDMYIPRGFPSFDSSFAFDSIFDTTIVVDTTIDSSFVFDTSIVEDTVNDTITIDTLIDSTLVEDTLTDSTTTVDTTVDSMQVVDTIPAEDAELAFETGPYSQTFSIDQLRSIDTVIWLDDGNAVAFQAVQTQRCPRGFMNGGWGFNDEGEGVFRGMWKDQHGRVTGWLQGHFERNENGRQVFYGKWISKNGQFEGFLRGMWKPHPNRHANPNAFKHAGGWLKGKIYDANRNPIGDFRGHYQSRNETGKGFFQARWRLECPSADDDDRWDDDEDRWDDDPWDDDDDDDDHDDDDHGNGDDDDMDDDDSEDGDDE